MILNELKQAYQKIRPINGQVFPKLIFLALTVGLPGEL